MAISLLFWKLEQETIPKPLTGPKLGSTVSRFANQGRALVSASNDRTIRVRDVP